MRADPEKVMRLLKTARGQVDGIMKMVEENKYCLDVSHQLLACEAILRKANKEILKGHIQGCVKEAFESESVETTEEKIEELLELMDKISK